MNPAKRTWQRKTINPFMAMSFGLLVLAGFFLDQGTKMLAYEHLRGQPPLVFADGLAILVYSENTGAFLGLGDQLPSALGFIILILLPCFWVAASFLPLFFKFKSLAYLPNWVFGLLITGSIGNLYDRIMRDRSVIDFMNVGIGSLRTGIFNVADLFLMAALGSFIIISFIETRRLKRDSIRLEQEEQARLIRERLQGPQSGTGEAGAVQQNTDQATQNQASVPTQAAEAAQASNDASAETNKDGTST